MKEPQGSDLPQYQRTTVDHFLSGNRGTSWWGGWSSFYLSRLYCTQCLHSIQNWMEGHICVPERKRQEMRFEKSHLARYPKKVDFPLSGCHRTSCMQSPHWSSQRFWSCTDWRLYRWRRRTRCSPGTWESWETAVAGEKQTVKRCLIRQERKTSLLYACSPAAHCKVGRVASHVKDHVAGRQVQEVLLVGSLIGAHNRLFGRGWGDVFDQDHLCILVDSRSSMDTY